MALTSLFSFIASGLMILTAFGYPTVSLGSHYSSTNQSVLLRPTPTTMGYGCYYYQYLGILERATNNRGYRCDSGLKGWYVLYEYGRYAQIPTSCPLAYNHYGACGTEYAGWLLGTHPSQYDGVQARTVCFSYARYGSCQCSYTTTIYVQNCGGFYSYWLNGVPSCTAGYCASFENRSESLRPTSFVVSSSVQILSSPTPLDNGCYYYQRLSTYDRSIGRGGYRCDSGLKGWYVFSDYGQYAQIPTSCPLAYNYYGACGTEYAGWLLGTHPSRYDGVQARTVCFSYARSGSCGCSYSTTIYVQNCGGFYSYWLNGVPSCNAGYCASFGTSVMTSFRMLSSAASLDTSTLSPSLSVRWTAKAELTSTDSMFSSTLVSSSSLSASPAYDGCSFYGYLSESDRSTDEMKRGWSCDRYLKGWYRFQLNGQDAVMPTTCPFLFNQSRACGSQFAGWLLGEHPRSNNGTYRRTVCFSKDNASCACSYTRDIAVRSCGSFYVYFLDGVPTCPSRYCSEYDTTKSKQRFTELQGTIRSPQRQNGNYGNGENIQYILFFGDGKFITLTFLTFETEHFHDSLYIYSLSNNSNQRLLHKFNGNSFPSTIMFQGNIMLQFTSDGSVTNKGFRIRYSVGQLNLICKPKFMEVKIIPQGLGNLNFILAFRNESCRTDQFAELITGYDSCGTTGVDRGNYINYENEVNVYVKESPGRPRYIGTHQVACEFDKAKDVISSGYQVRHKILDRQDDYGRITFELRMYQTEKYNRMYLPSEYPVRVKSGEMLFLELYAEIETKSTSVILDRCYSSSTSVPNSGEFVPLINQGCPFDDNTEIVPSSSPNMIRFKTRGQKYIGSTKTRYIHCHVYLCLQSLNGSNCTSPCQSAPDRLVNSKAGRTKRNIKRESSNSKTYQLAQGPIETEDEETTARTMKTAQKFNHTSIVLGVVVGLLALTIIALIVERRRTRHSSGNCETTD